MSIEYPCVYFYGNGMCSYGGDRSEANICVFGPCENETSSNGDMIRRMSDKELAALLFRKSQCPPQKNHITCGFPGNCEACWNNWLQQPKKDNYREE